MGAFIGWNRLRIKMEQVIEAFKTALPGLLGATSQAVVLTKGTIKMRAGSAGRIRQ